MALSVLEPTAGQIVSRNTYFRFFYLTIMAGQVDPAVGHPPLPATPAAHDAALLGDVDTLTQLCKDAANVEARDQRGFTTLMAAVENVDVREVVRLLILQWGADVNAKQVGNFSCTLALSQNDDAILFAA